MAFVVFLIVRTMNRALAKKEEQAAELEENCPFCKTVVNPGATRCHACTSVIETKNA
jgi:phage FluMu protein Com